MGAPGAGDEREKRECVRERVKRRFSDFLYPRAPCKRGRNEKNRFSQWSLIERGRRKTLNSLLSSLYFLATEREKKKSEEGAFLIKRGPILSAQ